MTRMQALLVFAISLSSVAVSQLLLKAGLTRLASDGIQPASLIEQVRRGIADPLLWTGGALLVTGMLCWYVAMTRLPLSLMMPLAALIAPAVALGAWACLGEPLTLMKIAAISVIAVGAIWLGWLNA